MGKENNIRTGRHCVFLMHVHLVFVTKYRRGVFTKKILDDLEETFTRVCSDFAENYGATPCGLLRTSQQLRRCAHLCD